MADDEQPRPFSLSPLEEEREGLEEGVGEEEMGGTGAPPPAAPPKDDESVELGDRILIIGGRLDKTRGRVYYMDAELIRVLPDGVSDRLVDIPIVDGDLDPGLAIESMFILQKRAQPAFVSQIDAHVGQVAETFDANGEPGPTFTIAGVDEANDAIALLDETGAQKEVLFDFIGVPQDESFAVLRPRDRPSTVEEPSEEEAAAAAEANAAAAAEEEELFELIEEGLEGGEEEEAEESGVLRITAIPTVQQTFKDDIQRNEMLQEMNAALEPAARRNPRKLRDIRRVVESMMMLRNDIVQYGTTGKPVGAISSSYATIADLLEDSAIPLSRPVLDAARILFLDHSIEGSKNMRKGRAAGDPLRAEGFAVKVEYLQDFLAAATEFYENQVGGSEGAYAAADALPNWFTSWQRYNNSYFKTFTDENSGRGAGAAGERMTFRRDTDVFLGPPVPDGTTANTDGLLPVGGEKGATATVASVGKVHLQMVRALGPRMGRMKAQQPPRRIESGEEGSVINTLIFPLSVERDMGVVRTGSFARDLGLSAQRPKPMRDILRDLGGVADTASAGGILSIGEGGNTAGNIPLEDWIRAQPMILQGLGDGLVQMQSLGLTQKELTVEQQAAVLEKVELYRALVKQAITDARGESARALADLRLQNVPFLQAEALEQLLETLTTEPLLAQRIDDLKRRLPAYRENDLAIMAALNAEAADLVVAVLGGAPGPLARERNRKVRDQFLGALRDALARSTKARMAGEEPVPISCPHVESLQAIRKVKNDDDRMKLLARSLALYNGGRKDNWILCSNRKGGEHNFMCYHEVLLLQEFLHPMEKDTIHKEILLTFSGGVFEGKYMCKNCGQPIADQEFDTHLEYDDEGRPMSGRAVLEQTPDITAEMLDKLDELIDSQNEGTDLLEFKSETQSIAYKTAHQLYDRLGISAARESYLRIVERVEAEILKQPSREDFVRTQKAKGVKAPDYDVLINRVLVLCTAAQVLVDIQCHVPEYVMRYKLPGCRAGFSGWPLGSEKDLTGLEYVACAIASITRSEAPWGFTGFLRESSFQKRRELVTGALKKLVEAAVATAPVQQQLTDKRLHNEKVYGIAAPKEGLAEVLPNGFVPTPYVVKPEEAAAAVVVPEAASDHEKVRAWIEQAHRIARAAGTYVKGSPFTEATCCSQRIDHPREFWGGREAELPTLPKKEGPRGPRGGHCQVHFKVRREERLMAEIPDDILYRLFLKFCYDGPRKGQLHEPGYMNSCAHCGFTFPDNPFTARPVAPSDKELFKEWQGEQEAFITRGKTALESQEVETDKAAFDTLLDAVHLANQVESVAPAPPPAGIALLQRFAAVEPEPFEGWRTLLAETIRRVSTLGPAPEELEVAEAYGPLSAFAEDFFTAAAGRIGADNVALLRRLLKQAPTQVVESVRTYVLTPCMRALQKVQVDSLVKVKKSYDLGTGTNEDLERILRSHLNTQAEINKRATGFAADKMQSLCDKLGGILMMVRKELRAPFVPGGAFGLPYLLTALVGGLLAEFIDPNVVPTKVTHGGAATTVDTTARAPLQILHVCLRQFDAEGLQLTADEIRERMAQRADMEKRHMITKGDKMSPEEKALDKLNRKLGLAEYAVGGSKAIYRYDADHYEFEREQRIQFGLGDFVTGAANLDMPPELAEARALADAGYDNAQVGEDDF